MDKSRDSRAEWNAFAALGTNYARTTVLCIWRSPRAVLRYRQGTPRLFVREPGAPCHIEDKSAFVRRPLLGIAPSFVWAEVLMRYTSATAFLPAVYP